MKDLIIGARYLLRGFSLIRQPGLRKFVAIPLLLNIVVFSVAFFWGFSSLNAYLAGLLPGWLSWLNWILLPLFSLASLLVVFYCFTLLANLIGAPFNAILSEKVEAHLGYSTATSSQTLKSLPGETIRTVGNELRKILYLAGWSIPLLILFIIPGINILAPALWMLFSSWMLALQYIDYPMGNHGFTFKQEKTELGRRRWMAWGFGGGIMLMTLVPVLNFFAMPVGVAGATALWLEHMKK